MLLGFVFGLALLISIKQIPKLLGIEAEGESAVDLVRDIVPQLRETDLLTLAVGLAGIAAMVLLERRLPRVPAALVVLLASIGVSVALGLEGLGVKVVGDLPAGLRGPTLPGVGLEAIPLLLFGAVGIALVAFAEAIGPANEFAREHGGKIDPNRELIAIGAANTGAGLFTGFPIGSSLSKSAANDRAGARTPASLVTAAAATALVALFLTPLFEPLPEATLGAIVIVAVFGMMKVGKLRRLWELRRIDFWLAMIALVGVLVMPTLEALGIAVVASLAVLVWRASEGRVTFLGRASRRPGAGGPGSRAGRGHPGAAHRAPGRDALLRQRGLGARRDPRRRWRRRSRAPSVVLLDLSLTPEVDVPVVEALEDLHQRLAADGIELWLAYLRPDAKDLLDRAGVLATIGDARIHARVVDAILAFAPPPAGRRRAGRRPDGPAGVHPRARGATGHECRGGGDPGGARTAPGGRACRRGRGTRTSLIPIARAGGRAARAEPDRLRSSARARVPATAAHDAPDGQVVAELHEVGPLPRLEAAPVRHAEQRQRLA